MIITVDTGGTKTLVGRFSIRGTLETTEKFATPKSLQEYFDILLPTIQMMSKGKKISAIALALPGEIKEGGTLLFAQHIGWTHDINIKALLETSFDCPIFIENDANLAGLAEIHHLNTTPKIGLYITVSTGIGTGLIVNGKILPEWSPSEGGHMILERDGVFAPWESFASGSAIYKRYKKYARDITSDRVWHEIAKDIGRGIIALSPLLRPEIIVIGGSIGTYFTRYEKALTGILTEQLREDFIPKLIRASHPEQAVIYGCYLYATDHLKA